MVTITIDGNSNDTNLLLNSNESSIIIGETYDTTMTPPLPRPIENLENIVTIASETSNLTKLVELLSLANLVNTVKDASSLTVLAPVNSAFEAIEDVLATLDAATVKDVLLSHVIESSVLSSDLTNGMEVKTLGSLELTVKISGDKVTFVAPGSEAVVTSADIKASNGIVHLIDSVLLPKLGDDLAPSSST